jgi:hypothetical protein
MSRIFEAIAGRVVEVEGLISFATLKDDMGVEQDEQIVLAKKIVGLPCTIGADCGFVTDVSVAQCGIVVKMILRLHEFYYDKVIDHQYRGLLLCHQVIDKTIRLLSVHLSPKATSSYITKIQGKLVDRYVIELEGFIVAENNTYWTDENKAAIVRAAMNAPLMYHGTVCGRVTNSSISGKGEIRVWIGLNTAAAELGGPIFKDRMCLNVGSQQSTF